MFDVPGGCVECLEPCKSYELDDGVCRFCRSRPQPRSVRPPPPFPTEHLPGTVGKLIVLEWRAANKFDLYHPDDAAADPRGSISTPYYPQYSFLQLSIHRVALAG